MDGLDRLAEARVLQARCHTSSTITIKCNCAFTMKVLYISRKQWPRQSASDNPLSGRTWCRALTSIANSTPLALVLVPLAPGVPLLLLPLWLALAVAERMLQCTRRSRSPCQSARTHENGHTTSELHEHVNAQGVAVPMAYEGALRRPKL